MPKHANRRVRGAAERHARRFAAKRTGAVRLPGALCGALSSLCILAGPAAAVTPLSTYFGPGLPLNNYFPQGVPGSADQPGVTVLTRERPEYDTPVIREGAFTIRPNIDEAFGYDSNVVGGAINGKGSSQLSSGGGVSVNTDASRYSLGVTAGVNNVEYWDVSRLSHTDYNASLGGSYNFGRDVGYASVSYQNANELPYDIGTNGSAIIQLNKPLNFSDTDFRASYSTEFGRFTVQPNVDYQLLRFARGDFLGVPAGAANAFDQTQRDSNVLQGGTVIRYEFQPERDAVLVVNGNYDSYTHGNQPNIGVVASTGATVLAGLDYQISGATTVRALGGYQQRFFEGHGTPNQGAPIGEFDVIWNPTGLTTVTAAYARTIEDATTDTVTGYTFDNLSLTVDHELYRNILLEANALLRSAGYQNSNLQQQNYGGGAGVTYLVNRHIQLALSYQFTEHTSSSGFVDPVFARQFGGNVPNSFAEHSILLHLRFGI